jgi:hypothetical protein
MIGCYKLVGVLVFNKVLFEDKTFKIIKSEDYVVIRKDKAYSFHSHFRRYSGAMGLIRLFYKQIKPSMNYFYIAMQRITTKKEFKDLKGINENKKYYNKNKNK